MRVLLTTILATAVTLAIAVPVLCQTQQASEKSSISGTVTLEGHPQAGITIYLQCSPAKFSRPTTKNSKKTDAQGRYTFDGLAPGECEVQANAYSRGSAKQSHNVMIETGENITGVDFSFSTGGVITGRVIDSDGRPVVRGSVWADRDIKEWRESRGTGTERDGRSEVDDRGVYRIFGLSPGKYEVYYSPGFGSWDTQRLTKTYYPSTTDEEKASMVAVKAGMETTAVNIVPAVASRSKTFKAMGRLINKETGQPMPDIEITAFAQHRTDTPPLPSGWHRAQSDAAGNFTIEGLTAATYSLDARSYNGTAWFSEDIEFTVTNGDVAGLELQLHRGAFISGTVKIEGTSDPAVLAMLNQLSVHASFAPQGANVSSDGGFRVTGIAPGNVDVRVYGPGNKFSVVRLEKDGLDLGQSVKVASGEEVAGLQVIVGYCNGSIRGQVRVVGGPLPPGAQMSLVADPPGKDNDDRLLFAMMSPFAVEPDLRGRFLISNLKPGEHQVVLVVTGLDALGPESPFSRVIRSEPVTVSNDSETEMTITLDLTPKQKSPGL
ncbi:MAG TPA: carboxypeptidase-like regulatory domain-containing protein [Blastocatellia bacterium]|nr:carboxypeptidase-like regulatory domain-containing protein [Blastocatellia bacterium]